MDFGVTQENCNHDVFSRRGGEGGGGGGGEGFQ